jgi:hypothetical protein
LEFFKGEDLDFFEELSQYNSFLNLRISQLKTNIKKTKEEIQGNEMIEEGEKEEVSDQVDVYKQQKESLNILNDKLLSKFQEIVDNAQLSFVKLENSIKTYEETLEKKKKDLTENSSMYYNLKNISDSSISKDIEKRIEEHLKFLEASGNSFTSKLTKEKFKENQKKKDEEKESSQEDKETEIKQENDNAIDEDFFDLLNN